MSTGFTEAGLPVALEAAGQQEDETWRCVSFVANIGLVEVIRNGDGYYKRQIDGLNDPKRIDELSNVPLTSIDRTKALTLRHGHDDIWRLRPRIAANLVRLYQGRTLITMPDGTIYGNFLTDTSYGYMESAVSVKPDGTIIFKKDVMPSPHSKEKDVAVKEFRLPRSTSIGRVRKWYIEKKREPIEIYVVNPTELAYHVSTCIESLAARNEQNTQEL